MYKKLLFGLLAVAGMTACSSDEPNNPGGVQLQGDEMAINIRLVDTNSASSRGTDANPVFEYGTQEENAVKTADFYFFNNDGSYNQKVSRILSWQTGTTPNIERIADATVLLKNLQGKLSPTYVVAVLNSDTDFSNKTLAELKSELLNSYKSGQFFVMTNSTYDNQDATSQYFATKLEERNFHLAQQNGQWPNDNPVEIYVERLAAKVNVLAQENLLTDGKVKITQDVNNGTQDVPTDIYIALQGWGLNGVAKENYVFKNVPAWNTDLTGANWATSGAWSDTANYRSYWALSPVYGKAISDDYCFPASYGQAGRKPYNLFGDIASTVNTTDRLAQSAKAPLVYTNWNSLTATLGGNAYCMENTNTEANLKADNIFYSKVTSVLLKAQAQDATGHPMTLVRYYGKLYSEDGFKAMILNALKDYAYSYTETAAPYSYASITWNDLEVTEAYDGTVTIQLGDAGKAKKWSSVNAGDPKSITSDVLASRINALELKADWYTNGMMYYCVPIEHLRGGKIKFNDPGVAGSQTDFVPYDVQEADYGIVRNHLYRLTITKIENLGTAVHDPEEIIIPNTQTQSYYIGSQVNILAWKIVSQNVEL